MSWRVDRGKHNSRVRLVVYGLIYSGGVVVMKLVMKKVEASQISSLWCFSKYSKRALFSFVLEEEIVSSELDKKKQKIMKETENCPGKRFQKISDLRSEKFQIQHGRQFTNKALESKITQPFSRFQPITSPKNP